MPCKIWYSESQHDLSQNLEYSRFELGRKDWNYWSLCRRKMSGACVPSVSFRSLDFLRPLLFHHNSLLNIITCPHPWS